MNTPVFSVKAAIQSAAMTKQKLIAKVGTHPPEISGCWFINWTPALTQLLLAIVTLIYVLTTTTLMEFLYYAWSQVNYTMQSCPAEAPEDTNLRQIYTYLFCTIIGALTVFTFLASTIICLMINSMREKSDQWNPGYIIRWWVVSAAMMNLIFLGRSFWLEYSGKEDDLMFDFEMYGLTVYILIMVIVRVVFKKRLSISTFNLRTKKKATKVVAAPAYQNDDTKCILMVDSV